jgi:RNA polymerase sigma factor (sigma-70 family)
MPYRPSAPGPDYSALGDGELVALIRQDDARAYGELWKRHLPTALAAARRITRRFEAEDLAAESFARVLKAIQAGGGPHTAFRTYLTTTIRNVAVNWVKAQPTAVSLEAVQEIPAGEDAIALFGERDALARALSTLPERWRTALWYREVEGLTLLEMAAILGIQPSAVAMLNLRARRGLLKALQNNSPVARATNHSSRMEIEK